MREALEELTHPLDYDQQYAHAAAVLAKYPEVKK
jgi:hypothetical protein